MNDSKSGIIHRVWNDDQCEQIMDAVHKVLETTGCLVRSEKARKLLKEAGCAVDGEKVTIPRKLLQWAIKTAPSSFTLYNRTGESAMDLEVGNIYYGPTITVLFVKNYQTGEKLRGARSDAVNSALICDALPNTAWASAMCSISDGVGEFSGVYEVNALLRNTKKPIMYWAEDMKTLKYEVEMIEAAADSAEAAVKKPFSICLICPTNPLVHQADALEQIMFLAAKKLPVVYCSDTLIGCSTPITLAGSTVVGLADTLVGLLVAQLTCNGAPFVISNFSHVFDMKTTNISEGAPEAVLSNIAAADVYRYLNLPCLLTFGGAGSGILEMTVFDSALALYTGAICGNTMNLGLCSFEDANLIDYRAAVFGDEAVGYIRKLVENVEINDETLALESIAEVGPQGNFLGEEATVEKYRDFYLHQPGILLRKTLNEWNESGQKDIRDILNEKVKSIISAGPQNPLPVDRQQVLDQILAKAETEYTKHKEE
jgi:trimethylamine--corrinoid protein Co-methyltransferase